MTISESELYKKYNTDIWFNLYSINNNRAKFIAIMTLITILSMVVIDYFNFQRGLWSINSGYILLFYAHIAYILSLSILLVLYFFYKENPNFHKIFSIIFSFLTLNLSAYTSGWVDQLIHGQITVYLLTCFIIAFLFCFERKYTIILFLQSYICLVYYLLQTQKNSDVLQGHLINALIIVLMSCFISLSFSNLMKRDHMYKFNLEELVKTRSDDLIMQQQAINHLQKFNLLGELSAGIAHEIRNPLTTVRGFLQLLGSKDYNEKDKEFYDLMISELDRANSILNEFLSLTKEKRPEFKRINLNSIILKLVPLLDTNSAYDIITDFGEIPEIRLDEKEICQVILNLANNGFEAMTSGGCLTIRTYKADDSVVMEIKDEGQGLSPEALEKIGTPFFTTKDKGTGLGIATCKSIINQHNAKFEIESSPKGATFRVIFNIL